MQFEKDLKGIRSEKYVPTTKERDDDNNDSTDESDAAGIK